MLSPIEIYEQHQAAFDRYAALLRRWNEKINLTAITEPDQIRKKHFLDSLTLAAPLDLFSKNVSRETFRVLDIGAGGGFPGLPLKMALPHLDLTLVDAVKKKCDFIKTAARELGLKDVKVVHETLSPQSDLGGKFHAIISRAAFSLKDLLELALPQREGAAIIFALKSEQVGHDSEEVRQTLPLLKSCGLELKITPYQIDSSEPLRNLITISPS